MESENIARKVKAVFNPPSLILKQFFSLAYQGWLTDWKGLPRWILKGNKVIATAAGATSIGCTGYPYHVVWEITNRCNLDCIHCYASSVPSPQSELTTLEGKQLLEKMTEIPALRMIVITGGEPLIRNDIFELVEYAGKLGFKIVFSTNGTLLTHKVAGDLVKMGVVNFSISLDGSTAEKHETIRPHSGCFNQTLEGIKAAAASGVCLQINFTAMKQNLAELPQVIDLAEELGADICMVFQTIPPCKDRGAVELNAEDQNQLLRIIREKQRQKRMLLMPVCSPEYWPLIANQHKNRLVPKSLKQAAFSGCGAGRGFCYIRFDGNVWPCNFIPLSAGNVRESSFADIWRNSALLQQFYSLHKNLKDACGQCADKQICGGCRGRAYAHFGDFWAADPNCNLVLKNKLPVTIQ
ncbi:MAG TPA: radical SAM protein [Dehalococcoidales bacterium]|nr:radical SAM protein [Dehalococcoidales bacterium]